MNIAAALPTVSAERLSRFACDFCREKKIRCSRERPKCSTCRPWPGECAYSKEDSSTRQPPRAEHDKTACQELEGIHKQLQLIEGNLKKLNISVDALSRLGNSSETHGLAQNTPQPGMSKCVPTTETDLGHQLASQTSTLEDPNVFSASPSSSVEYLLASTRLRDVTKPIWTLGLDTNQSVASKPTENTCVFFVPSDAIGSVLINRFFQITDLTDLLAVRPSDETLRKVVFHPHSVCQRGWVLYINFIFLILSRRDPTLSDLTASFQRNTRLALNDARIFLESSEVNIQALALLACLGEEYTSPKLSWMLAGHACQQAQISKLHLVDKQSSESGQRRLTLFWVLFMIDKACSLAFGRPALLPSAVYQHVQLPTFQHLKRFRPRQGQPSIYTAQPPSSTFGAHFFRRSIELAKLTGFIIDVLTVNGRYVDRQRWLTELDEWHSATIQILSEARQSDTESASTEELEHMSLGIRVLRFRYLHILVLLLQGESQYAALQLESAREAVALLPDLVSNGHHVYQGIVWQLLYYPLSPFLALFNHITQYPQEPSASQDLELLTTTISYLQSIRASLPTQSIASSKLERMAEIFVNCARSTIWRGLPGDALNGIEELDLFMDSGSIHDNQDIDDSVMNSPP